MAYTNFQHCTEEEYTNIIYSQDAKNKIKILFNNVELANADRYCEKLTRKERILPDDSSKRFSLDNFVSQEVELILHDVDSSVIKDQVSISIGTLVDENNDVYEYVPLGIFNIQDTPTTDKNKITVKLRDNRVKFDFNYNGKELIDAHDGSATKLQILQDICDKAGVQTTITSFAGDSDLIGIYDNTITATTYISYLAEQAGAIAKIDREGKLIFTYLTDSKDATIAGSGSISDSFNGGLISTQIEGKAEQHSYSGKNYANTNKDPDWKYGNTVWERSGSNITVKDNGTSTYAFVEYYVDNLKPNTTYTFSFDAVANDNGIINTAISYPRATGGVTIIRFLNTAGKTAHLTGQFTTPSDTSGICIILYSVRGTYKANAKTTYSNIQIEEGSSETSYEPYVGGTPSPNPDYPQEIKTVSGIENLFDKEDASPTTTATTVTQIDTGIQIKNNTAGYGAKINITNLKQNTNYYLSYNWENVSNGHNRVFVFAGTGTSTTLGSKTNGDFVSFNTGNNTTINIWFYAQSNAIGEVKYKNIQLEESSTPHQYVPYGHWLPVKVSNRNLFDESQLLEATDWTKNEDGYYNGTNRNLQAKYGTNSDGFNFPETFKENTSYTISFNAYVSEGQSLIRVYYTDDTQSNIVIPNTTSQLYQLTTDNAKTISKIIGSYLQTPTAILYIKNIQIEEGTITTDYIEHQEQTALIDLNKYDSNNNIVGNYEICTTLTAPDNNLDVLTIKDGRAILTKRMEKYVADSNSPFYKTQDVNGLYHLSVRGTPTIPYVGYRGISNCFINNPDTRITANAQANQYLSDGQFAFRWAGAVADRDRIYFKYLAIPNDITAFKQLMVDNNFTLYYRQTAEDITLRGTYDINLYEGVNYISIEDELEPTMNVTYSIEKNSKRIPLSIVEKYEIGEPYSVKRIVYEDAIRKYQTSEDETLDTLYINSANPYITNETQINNISSRTKNFILDSVKTGKILGNPALDSYDIIEIYDDYSEEEVKPIIFKTLANNTLKYNGVLISEYDTQIGKEQRTENVSINGESTFRKWAKTEIDNNTAEIKMQTGRIDTVQNNLTNDYYNKGNIDELIINASTGVTNTFSEAGGNNIFRNTGLWFEQNDTNNPYEFWNGKVTRIREDKAANRNAMSLQNGRLYQDELVPNGNYTISFKYKKLITLATAKVIINNTEYELTETEDTEFEQSFAVNSQNIRVEFVCDVNDGCEVYDLMVNAGSVKLAYSQNQNETTTSTVNISKGITITSSDLDVKFKADADGIRTLDSNNTELTKFTDKGMTTKEAIIQNKSQIVGTLWQEVGGQTWITRL